MVEPPAITRQRRPFLLPVWLTMLAVLLVIGAGLAIYRSATTTLVVLVRPVERELGTIDDPPLSPEGEQRAQRLARMLGEARGAGRLDAIYVSDARGAQQTAAPLAERLGKRPVVISGNDANGTAARVMHEHEGAAVLVIASSSSIPQLIHELSGLEAVSIAEDEPDVVYIVSIPTFGRASLLRLKY